MRVSVVEITLAELQEALRQHLLEHLTTGEGWPDRVDIVSDDKRIAVELHACGIVAADEFRHRA